MAAVPLHRITKLARDLSSQLLVTSHKLEAEDFAGALKELKKCYAIAHKMLVVADTEIEGEKHD